MSSVTVRMKTQYSQSLWVGLEAAAHNSYQIEKWQYSLIANGTNV